MQNIYQMINKFTYQSSKEKYCNVIKEICDKEIVRMGLMEGCRVLHVSNSECTTYLVQIISNHELLMKPRNIALLDSLISRKSSDALRIKHTNLKVIVSVVDPKVIRYLSIANSLSIEQIGILLSIAPAKRTDTRVAPAIKIQGGHNRNQKESDLPASNSLTVSEVDFEEYLAAETKNLKNLIAKRRDESKKYTLVSETRKPNFDYQSTTPSGA